MKKFIYLILILSNAAYADCNWSSIQPLKDGGYEYPTDVHLCVGNLVQDYNTKNKQIQDLTSAITLKDEALTSADARTKLWTDAAEAEQNRMLSISANESKTQWMYFGLGVITVLGAGFMAAKLIGR